MIVYEIVNRKHAITDINCPEDFDPRMKKWWKSMNLYYCSNAVLAFDKKNGQKTLIGFFRFDKNARHLYAWGTYVLPAYRSQRIAKKLWLRAIRYVKPHYIEVTTASRGGARLVAALVKKYTKIDWYISRSFS